MVTLHPATAQLVDEFGEALKQKLLVAQVTHGWTIQWQDADWREELQHELLKHVVKGDPRDVAAYCAFAWHHCWPTSGPLPVWAPHTIADSDGDDGA